MFKNEISVYKTSSDYCTVPPFNPSMKYPEYQFSDTVFPSSNVAYEAVRESFHLLGYDDEHYGTPNWNPLGQIINQGDSVLLKPNFVYHKNMSGDDIFSVITHPSVIRAIVDYAYIALNGEGKIIIADSPNGDADFDEILNQTQLHSIKEKYQIEKSFNVEIMDLRKYQFVYNSKDGVLHSDSRILLEGDPLGYCEIDLGDRSMHKDIINPERIYGADYDRSETIKHHSNGHHRYCISKTVLSANVIINVPKIKTHRKAGVTLAMKNMVGINTDKNYLPHFRIGLPEDGGDEFPFLTSEQKKVLYSKRKLSDALLSKPNVLKDSIYRFCYKIYKKAKPLLFKNAHTEDVINGGSWYGNDTLWRTIYDLNAIISYADEDGRMRDVIQRKMINLADGIIAGEGNGPLSPTRVGFGVVVFGSDAGLVDATIIRLMGLNIDSIPLYSRVFPDLSVLSKTFIRSNDKKLDGEVISNSSPVLRFKPALCWDALINSKEEEHS